MSTKNIFPLVIAGIVLALTGLGAANFVSARTQILRGEVVNQTSRAESMRLLALNAQHSEALAQEPLSSNDRNARHSEALAQEPAQSHVWHGATRQTSPLPNLADAERRWDLMVEHSEALQEVAP